MTEPRRCEISNSYETQTGNFIQYGSRMYFDDGNNPHPQTIAIVERDDGQVVEVEPHKIKFLK